MGTHYTVFPHGYEELETVTHLVSVPPALVIRLLQLVIKGALDSSD